MDGIRADSCVTVARSQHSGTLTVSYPKKKRMQRTAT